MYCVVKRVEFNLFHECLNRRAFEVSESLTKWLHSWKILRNGDQP
jgi:hypothetical protein